MEEHDAFLTRTIVGAPFCALLGQRLRPHDAAAAGLNVDLRSGHSRLTEGWNDLVALGRASDVRGRPRSRPGALQRWLERHALAIAFVGMAALGASVVTVLAGARAWH